MNDISVMAYPFLVIGIICAFSGMQEDVAHKQAWRFSAVGTITLAAIGIMWGSLPNISKVFAGQAPVLLGLLVAGTTCIVAASGTICAGCIQAHKQGNSMPVLTKRLAFTFMGIAVLLIVAMMFC